MSEFICIQVNDQSQRAMMNCNLAQLLVSLNYVSGQIAVALNQEFVPRSCYADTVLQEGDQLEVLAAMEGG